jgi:hypothetical protein
MEIRDSAITDGIVVPFINLRADKTDYDESEIDS